MRAAIALLILALTPATAGASATYRWQSATGSGCCAATLEITNEAYAAGGLSLRVDYSGPPRAPCRKAL